MATRDEQYRQQERIVAARRNSDGDNVAFKLASGRIVDYREAILLAKTGSIEHVNVFRGRDGDEHLRSDADGIEGNNLDNLPTF